MPDWQANRRVKVALRLDSCGKTTQHKDGKIHRVYMRVRLSGTDFSCSCRLGAPRHPPRGVRNEKRADQFRQLQALIRGLRFQFFKQRIGEITLRRRCSRRRIC
jgi:hypothetical protein